VVLSGRQKAGANVTIEDIGGFERMQKHHKKSSKSFLLKVECYFMQLL